MQKQKILNKIMEFAYAQSAHCLGPDKKCLYNGPKGHKCFIGCLIPYDMYSVTMEDTKGIHGLVSCFPELYRLIKIRGFSFSDNLAFFEELQQIHDSSRIDEWESGFKSFAIRYNLNIEVTK